MDELHAEAILYDMFLRDFRAFSKFMTKAQAYKQAMWEVYAPDSSITPIHFDGVAWT